MEFYMSYGKTTPTVKFMWNRIVGEWYAKNLRETQMSRRVLKVEMFSKGSKTTSCTIFK